MSDPSKIKSKPYRNWVRGVLGLFYLQKGLYPFTDRVVKAEHARIVQYLTPCTSCAIENILPAHASGKVCIQKNKAKCNCRKKTNTSCATCSKIYDDIVLQHRFREPNWVADCSTWYSDHWEFAKCFLTTYCKGSNNTAAETDASGLLSIIVNGLFFQSEIQCNIDPPNDSFSQVREIRNEILHNSTQDLSDHDVTRYLKDMIVVLEDKTTLISDPAAQTAAKKIREILKDELIITISEEVKVIQSALDAIRVAREQSEESIRKLAEEKQNAIKVSEESIRQLAEEKQNDIKVSEESIRQLAEEKQNAIKLSEESIRQLAEEKQNDIKVSEESIRKLAEEKQNALKVSEESIRQLAEEKQIAIKVSEESIRQLAEEKQNAIKESEESIQKLVEENKTAVKASEDSIKEITDKSHNALQQQTKESTTEIKRTKEQAIENVSSTVSRVVEETCVSEIKILSSRQNDYENRLKAIEIEQQNLQLKQLELEKQVARLKTTEDKHQTRLEYLKQEQGLQQHLVGVYQKHYVKTWISPLMTQQNDVNIRDVYVSPRMVVEENEDGKDGNTTGTGKGREANSKHIERYRDLFKTHEKRNKEIFIIGDVGTGKSSFCKMMMQNWCSAITKRGKSDELDVVEEDYVKQGEECNTCDMNQFYFLFFIPLGEMSGKNIDDIVDMIKDQLKNYKELIDNIFKYNSERILILADGLDELTSFNTNNFSLHQVTRSACDSIIVTTSRPSSRGILNMKSSDYDLKVTLLGLDYSSVKPMIEKYMKLLNKTSDLPDFKKKLYNLKVKDIQNAPMLLQQIIWLYCNNYAIGQSRSFIYLHIVNAVLGWEQKKIGAGQKLHDFQSSELEHLSLPKSFDKFARCQKHRILLLFLGKIAYDAYIMGGDSSLVFSRYKLNQLGASDDGISVILRIGILTEVKSADPTYEESRLSFIHTSYLEFFAALYICSCYLSKITDADSTGTRLNMLEDLIAVTPETSAAEILRLENVLIMMCGLVPCLTEHVCECIYKVSLGYNNTFLVACRKQYLMFDCLSEHYSIHEEAVKLRHLCISSFGHEAMSNVLSGCVVHTSIETYSIECFFLSHEQCSKLSSCLSQAISLRTLKIDRSDCTKDGCEGHIIDLTNHRELQCIELSRSKILVSGINLTCLESCKISAYELSHEQYSLLSSYLSQAVSLRTLKIDRVECTKDHCEGHIIDLTNHRELQSIELSRSKISVSGINHTCLESCKISYCRLSHEQCTSLSQCLSQATSLKTLKLFGLECTETECKRHSINCHDVDLTNHEELEILSVSNCNTISVTRVNPTCPLRKCYISNYNLSHEQCTSLYTFLSRAESLQHLILSEIKCVHDACVGHDVDLCNHKQLKFLSISNCHTISVTCINPTCTVRQCVISNCNLSHEQCTSLYTFLSRAESLHHLKLSNIKCVHDACACHDVDLTKHRQLQSLYISNCNTISVTGIHPTCPIWQCYISNCNLSHEQCTSLCTFLSHTESLNYLVLSKIKCVQDSCAGHGVDLTKHRQLTFLYISNCNMISITGINPTCPIWQCTISTCNLSHE